MLSVAVNNTHFKLSAIKAMELAAAKIPGSISLAQGIPSFETPAIIRDFIKEKIDQGQCDKYSLTNGLTELREEISYSLAGEGLAYDPDSEIIVTAGSIEGITAAVLAATNPGDEILIPSPTYASYQGSAAIARAAPRFFSLDEDNNFDFQIEAVKEALTPKVKALLYCSPNNPTGTLFSEAKTRALVELCAERDITVIIDEVYKDFYYTDDKHFTPVSIPEFRKNVIRVCSFSKAFAMTGWRVGFIHADASRTQQILKYHDAMVSCAPVASQFGAIAALRWGQPFLESFKAEFRRRRNLAVEWMDRMSYAVDYQTPKATYFVFPRIKDSIPLSRDSHALAYDILSRVGVALVPGVAFGPAGEGHLRITYGKEIPVLEEAFGRIDDYFRGRHNKRRTSAAQSESEAAAPTIRASLRRAAAIFVGAAAKLYLARTKPKIIGIAGSKGKTVVKRIVADSLSQKFKTRSSILSFNTAIGLPLSVLNLTPPRTISELLVFPAKVLLKSIFGGDRAEFLVLEYGILRGSDAENLKRFAPPHWLIVTDLEGADPALDVQEISAGVAVLARDLPRERVLSFAAEDSYGCKRMLEEFCAGKSFAFKGQTITPDKEAVGRSSKAGIIAATVLDRCAEF